MTKILYQLESYQIMGILFDVHRNLGGGFSEIVYKDALEYEFKKADIPFEREKEYLVNYKDIILDHKFYADFVLFDKIILEIKSSDYLHPKHISQCLNYLKVSKTHLAILANFNSASLEHKRIIL
ncbi:GxxExxY protein [Flavobacterium aquidurense]|uniref:GxxExxY protein n=1 Tax=Flavobacterium aquidurense TaxID=362413 RepID=UPI002864A589|nr:GxxExxY protein [Flavobacterium aquidurense]MDR7371268.1 GxxExxY protein [Flavobacterium aquidurense]